MKYLGSKNRIAKELLPIILRDRKEGQCYVEPFVGGANMIDKVEGLRIGSDSNKYVIALLQEMQKKDYRAPKVDKELYNKIKENKDNYEDFLVGYAGTQLSFGSTWFGSYRKDNKGKRDYCLEARNNINKQARRIEGINFTHSSYMDLEIPSNSIIYCDPPYNTKATKGKYKDIFDHDIFWDWCRDKVKEGHTIYISEYSAPDDFKCIRERKITQKMNNNVKTKAKAEKLFTLK